MQMKRVFLTCVVGVFVFSSCVTKQKYNELQSDLTSCSAEREKLASQKINLDNRVIELETAVEKMKNQIRQLEADTLVLGNLSRDARQAYQNLQSDYDELSSAFKAMSAGSKREAELMLDRLQDAQAKLDEKERELKQLSDDLNKKSEKLIELQSILDKKDADVLALREKIKQALQGFESSGLQVTEKNGKVYISMDEKLLFASGKFSIDDKGKEALKALAKVLEADTDISITVEGHTDNVPFSPAASAQIRDNWDLSVMRATSVVKTILEYGDINPQRLTASGRSEYIPIDMEDTKDGRAKNRRTEIILTPQLDALFEILK